MLHAHRQDGDGADAPAIVINGTGRSALLLVCEHASNRIPDAYHGLGIDAEAAESHVAWDPGALAVARIISTRLDAPLVAGTVSRLVYDCNRPPEAPDAMPARSERFDIPGNQRLSLAERKARTEAVYRPFEARVSQMISDAERPPVLVTVHSFTPDYLGRHRDVQIGILHDTDARYADAMLACAPAHTALDVRRNEPYGPEDGVTHTLKRHALPRELHNVMLEVRNDLIADEAGQQAMGTMLSYMIAEAAQSLGIMLQEAEGTCSH